MIQRIQSIYLLIAAILMAVTAFSPILYIDGGFTLFSYGIIDTEDLKIIKPTWGIVFMASFSTILSFTAIFLYKRRKIQSKITLFSAFIILFFYITAIVYMTSYYSDFISIFSVVTYGCCLPIIAIIFLLLANIKIKKDEKLVRSLDRIR